MRNYAARGSEGKKPRKEEVGAELRVRLFDESQGSAKNPFCEQLG